MVRDDCRGGVTNAEVDSMILLGEGQTLEFKQSSP
jgi:hypothetical protein